MQATLIKVKNKPYQKQTCTMIVNICDGKKLWLKNVLFLKTFQNILMTFGFHQTK